MLKRRGGAEGVVAVGSGDGLGLLLGVGPPVGAGGQQLDLEPVNWP